MDDTRRLLLRITIALSLTLMAVLSLAFLQIYSYGGCKDDSDSIYYYGGTLVHGCPFDDLWEG